MKDRPGKPSKWRRWLIVAVCAALLIAGVFWISRPRFDRRMVGTWTDGDHRMVIRSDGVADCFFGQYSVPAVGRVGSYWNTGPYQVRTSGTHFEFVRRRHDRTTVRGFLEYILALINRDETESVEYLGTILSINNDAMTLDVKRQSAWDGLLRPSQTVKETARYRRIKEAPFNSEPFLPADSPSTE